ncbi:TolC family protein [Hymenobacter roseosalivarius]|uniref:TolC family protein n=1 Tax=Hymenobacter roseosalivarius TaxID=89967 RepID=UPI0013564DBD|nr:TolC family protein [Hymenobacter roseosalivarius]
MLLLIVRQGKGQQVLPYEDCVKRALQQNLLMKRALLDLEASTVRLKTQKADMLPRLNGSLRNNNSVGRSVDPLTNEFINRKFNSVSGSAGSSVYLFQGFKTANAIKAAKQEVEQNTDQLQALKNDITVDVALVYIRINYLLELIKSRQQQVESSADLVRLTRLKLKAGRVSESALYKLLSQQATEQLNLVNSQNELSLAYLDLRQILNAPPLDEILIKPLTYNSLAEIDFQAPIIEEVITAVEAQPALMAKQHNAARLYHQIAVIRADKYPSLQLTGSLGSNYSNTNEVFDFRRQFNNNMYYGTGLALTIPLFNSFRYNLLIRESRLRYQQSLLDSDIERNRLTKVVQQAIADAQAANQSWNAARKAEEFARKGYEADLLKYRYGTISVFELNQAKTTYVNAQTDLFRAKYELILRSKLVGFYQGRPLVL